MKKGSKQLLTMAIIYLILSLIAIIVIGVTQALDDELEEVTEVSGLSTKIITDDTMKNTEDEDLSDDEAVSQVTEPEAEPETAAQTDLSGQYTSNEPAATQEAEPAAEPAEPAAEPAPEVHYYSFKASHESQGLRVRKDPSMNGLILDKIDPGTEGLVIERGDVWSEISTYDGKKRGYSFNEYLQFNEITEEDYKKALDAINGTADAAAGDTAAAGTETAAAGTETAAPAGNAADQNASEGTADAN